MIREIIREAWAESPAGVVAAVLAAPLIVVIMWALLVFAIGAWG
jgi:hypothetical protein